MAESDEEYDRRSRGRDKFAKERNDFQENRGGGGGAGRRDFGGDRLVLGFLRKIVEGNLHILQNVFVLQTRIRKSIWKSRL